MKWWVVLHETCSVGWLVFSLEVRRKSYFAGHQKKTTVGESIKQIMIPNTTIPIYSYVALWRKVQAAAFHESVRWEV